MAVNRSGQTGFVAAPHPHHRRATFVRWVRKTHGWFGLWGAILGLTFGTSGIWLNHRAVLKLPAMEQVRINTQLALPDPLPENAQALTAWLQSTLAITEAPNNVRIEPSRPVAWTEKGAKPAAGAASASPVPATPPAPRLMQPEHWVISFGGPNKVIQADYWRGNRSVAVNESNNGLMATLTNMHKGNGMSVPWILLVDTLAGSLIFLSISGVILWVQTHRRRVVGLSLLAVSITVVGTVMVSRIWW